MVCCCVQEDLWLSAFPIGTEVCAHTYLLLRIILTTMCYALLLALIDCLYLFLQWENIDKIKEFNWNFQNLEVYIGHVTLLGF